MSRTVNVKLSVALLFLVAAAAVVTSVSAPSAAGAAQPGGGGAPTERLKVAVVDMDRVLQNSSEWRDAIEERMRMQERMKRALRNLSRHVQILRNEYENLPPGTDERLSKGSEFEKALQELRQSRLEFDKQIAEHHNKSIRSMFGKVSAAVSAYAQEHGISLVLKKQNLQFNGAETIEQSLMVATTEVLYADPALDISDAMIQRLNSVYPGPIEVK